MKPATILISLACAVGISSTHLHADEKTEPAITAAKAWLASVDAGQYRKSWQQAAPDFQAKITEDQWVSMLDAARKPLGKLVSRKLINATPATTLPNAPDGQYVVIRFQTSFADKQDAVETITPVKVDGTWRVAGYYIK